MSAPVVFPDADARREILEALDDTLFVEAAAGTGKTTALVSRIVSLLASGRGSLDRIVAVTFTEKAAGELKLRLRTDLERARAAASPDSEERLNLERGLERLELARISTIHGFCSDLLHERPLEAGVDPLFQVASQEEALRLLDRAFDAWFERVLDDPPEGVRRILRRRPEGFNASGPRELLRRAVQTLVEHRDFDALWRRDPFEREREIDGVMNALEALGVLADAAVDPGDWLAKNVANVGRFVQENAAKERVRGRDYDDLEAKLRGLARRRNVGWHYKGRNRKQFTPEVSREDLLERRADAKTALDTLCENADADLAACLQSELREIVAAYEESKQKEGVVDFVDLLLATRNLIARDRPAREALQARFDHYFVDEFQDTDPLQAEILLLLAADDPAQDDWQRAHPVPGKLFIVGDPKQSIYRFRRADVAIYEAIKRRLAGEGARVLQLTTSFRAPPSLQAAVNAAFAPRMQGAEDGSQAHYVALEGAKQDVVDRPTLVALPVPRPYSDWDRVVNWKIDESLPEATGAFVDWLVNESGWTVKERNAAGDEVDVPVQPRHVCLLFRRFRNFRDDATRGYVRALEARRIPHVLVGGRTFHDREEVLAIRNALAAIEWPEDQLSVFATLRGPLFALGDDALLAYKHTQRTLHPLAPIPEAGLEGGAAEVASALQLLRELHRGRNHRPIADTITRLLDALRAHAGIAIWPTGEQALANCLRMVDLARRFERRGALSFRAFVERLEEDALHGEAEDAPVVEEGTEGVRIMTAHRAKGLEFPVVILCDPTCKASREQPSRCVDSEQRLWAEPLAGCSPRELLEHKEVEQRRDAAESVRLAYVAATRARDLLVVPAVADHELEDSWLEPLHDVVYPDRASRGEGEPGAGCPGFGGTATVDAPGYPKGNNRASVRPGRLYPRAGTHTVTWWDPHALGLEANEDVGLRQTRVLEADASGASVAEGVQAHAAWQERRAARIEQGTRMTFDAAPITALAHAAAEENPEAEVAIETVPGDRAGRPHGKRFGTLVHEVLARLPLDADSAAVERAAELQGRVLGSPAPDVAAAADAVRAALAHPLLRRAHASAALRRETPVLLELEGGRLAEGVVDLAFREDEGWTVVDFKTDIDVSERRAVYAHQVELYVLAIARATGEPASGCLLLV
jgi:ATP-dependent exoDNAse (exonuclease V) beta subunit